MDLEPLKNYRASARVPEHYEIADALKAIGTEDAVRAGDAVERFGKGLTTGADALALIAAARSTASVDNIAFHRAADFVRSHGPDNPQSAFSKEFQKYED